MENENKIGFLAVIPSTVLYNEKLKPNSKLLYAAIMSLSNKDGYCYATNRYLGQQFHVNKDTITKWVTELRENGLIEEKLIRDDRGNVIERRIFPNIRPYQINMMYPYGMNSREGTYQKVEYNNIYYKIDRLFNYIINNKGEFPAEFSKTDFDEIEKLIERYEMRYTPEIIKYISKENLQKIKDIMYALALMVRDNLQHLNYKISRDKLLKIYNDCKIKEEENKESNNKIENFMNYYYKSIVNELTKERNSPSFFIPKNNEIDEIGGLDI